jgi:cyclic pyranopterin monophosphate synthase
MNDISHKTNTLRIATASCVVSVSDSHTMERIKRNEVPKGNIFEMAKAAGLLAIKKTSDVIPDCHPMPIEGASFQFEMADNEIHIVLEVKTVYKTGVEVEAMHGVSVAALTMYDMLKPIDKGVEIRSIRLLNKKGGKSDFRYSDTGNITAAVVVCSDTVYAGTKKDSGGKTIAAMLKAQNIFVADFAIVPDDKTAIAEKAQQYCNAGYDLVIFTGGTGVSPRDVTPEALIPLFDKELYGVEEAMRNYGQERTPYSMLSRSVAGTVRHTLLIALPGSVQAVEQCMHAIFPHVLHACRITANAAH